MALLKAAVPKEIDWNLINFKVTAAEKKKIVALAKKYAGGNVSLWLRYASMNCTPRKADLAAS